ncbi:hypothetical protein E4U43_004038, partial [Claviceps pusilla]
TTAVVKKKFQTTCIPLDLPLRIGSLVPSIWSLWWAWLFWSASPAAEDARDNVAALYETTSKGPYVGLGAPNQSKLFRRKGEEQAWASDEKPGSIPAVRHSAAD